MSKRSIHSISDDDGVSGTVNKKAKGEPLPLAEPGPDKYICFKLLAIDSDNSQMFLLKKGSAGAREAEMLADITTVARRDIKWERTDALRLISLWMGDERPKMLPKTIRSLNTEPAGTWTHCDLMDHLGEPLYNIEMEFIFAEPLM